MLSEIVRREIVKNAIEKGCALWSFYKRRQKLNPDWTHADPRHRSFFRAQLLLNSRKPETYISTYDMDEGYFQAHDESSFEEYRIEFSELVYDEVEFHKLTKMSI